MLVPATVSPPPSPAPPEAPPPSRSPVAYRRVLLATQSVMALELAALLWNGYWGTSVLVLVLMGITLAPEVFKRRLPVRIPYALQILAVLFVFATLFLGEVRNYYERFWWWDVALHASSGLLLGLVGFLLVYVLNANERVDLHLRPAFIALFAFSFALAIGALWEIFEFAMDSLFGLNMQKPMLGDPSGLTDTMWDLIVDALGALVISLFGWRYMRRGERSFIDRWIEDFTARNPRLFVKD